MRSKLLLTIMTLLLLVGTVPRVAAEAAASDFDIAAPMAVSDCHAAGTITCESSVAEDGMWRGDVAAAFAPGTLWVHSAPTRAGMATRATAVAPIEDGENRKVEIVLYGTSGLIAGMDAAAELAVRVTARCDGNWCGIADTARIASASATTPVGGHDGLVTVIATITPRHSNEAATIDLDIAATATVAPAGFYAWTGVFWIDPAYLTAGGTASAGASLRVESVRFLD